jgi:hypothetical protein
MSPALARHLSIEPQKAVERADEIRNRRGAFYEFAVIVEG